MGLSWSPGLRLALRCYFNLFCVDLECAVPVARGTLDLGKEKLGSKDGGADADCVGSPPAA